MQGRARRITNGCSPSAAGRIPKPWRRSSPSAASSRTWCSARHPCAPGRLFEPIRPALAGEPEERFLRALFEAGRDYLPLLRQEGGTALSLLLVGHNPATHETAVRLAADLDTPAGKELSARFPTAALAIFDFDGDWADIRPASMRLAAFITPHGGED